MSDIRIVRAIPTLETEAHAQGDVVGNRMAFTHLAGKGVDGYVVHVQVFDRGGVGPDLRLHLFPKPISGGSANAALTFAANDISGCSFFHTIDIAAGDFKTVGTGLKIASVPKLVLPIEGVEADLYGLLEQRGASDYTPGGLTDLEITLFVQGVAH
jgi:hypothetical protein